MMTDEEWTLATRSTSEKTKLIKDALVKQGISETDAEEISKILVKHPEINNILNDVVLKKLDIQISVLNDIKTEMKVVTECALRQVELLEEIRDASKRNNLMGYISITITIMLVPGALTACYIGGAGYLSYKILKTALNGSYTITREDRK